MNPLLQNPEAEVRALRTALVAQNVEVRSTVLGRLDATHFAYGPTQLAYGRLIELLGEVTVLPGLDVFLSDKNLTEEARVLLASPDITPVETVDDLNHLVHQLNEARQFRSFHNISLGINNQFKKKNSTVEVMTSIVEHGLIEVHSNNEKETVIYHAGSSNNSDAVVDEILDPESHGQVIPSGFDNFDKRVGGFRRGNLIVMAAPYKSGKSIIKVNSLLRQYRNHRLSVCDVTLEMNVYEEKQRIISNITGIDFERIYNHKGDPLTDSEVRRCREAWVAHKAIGAKHGNRFSIFPAASLTVSQVGLMLKPFNFDVIAIDYMNLLTPEGGAREKVDAAQIQGFGRQLKVLAKDLNCVIVALTQLDETTGNLRYSKAALEDANNVWAWMYGEAEKATHVIKVKQLASRSSRPFTFYLKENFATMEVTDHDGEFVEEEAPIEPKSFSGKKSWKA